MVESSIETVSKSDFEFKLVDRWAKRILQKRKITLYDLNLITNRQIASIVECLTESSYDNKQSINEFINKQNQKINGEKLDLKLSDSGNGDILDIMCKIFLNFMRFSKAPAKNAEESLLQWVKESLKDDIYKEVKVTDFKRSSWINGVAICSLIHSFNPKCINFDRITPFDHISNIRVAIFAANVLLNFENLFSYDELNSASEKALIFLIQEFYAAMKVAPKINASKKLVVDTITLFNETEQSHNLLKQKNKNLMNEFRRLNSTLETTQKFPTHSPKVIKSIKNQNSKSKNDVIDFGKDSFDNYLRTLRLNSYPTFEKTNSETKSALKKAKQILEKNQQAIREIENLSLDKTLTNKEYQVVDKVHLKTSKRLIAWVRNIRTDMASSIDCSTLNDIEDAINFHKSLNLVINSNRNKFRNILEKSEEILRRNTADEKMYLNAKERVSPENMFDVINREWKDKLLELRQVKESILNESKVNALINKYELLFEDIESRTNEFIERLIVSTEADNLLDAKRLWYRAILQKKNIIILNDQDTINLDEIKTEITLLSIKMSNTKKIRIFFEKKEKELKEINDKIEDRFNTASERMSDLIMREVYKEKVLLLAEIHNNLAASILRWCIKQKVWLEKIDLSIDSVENANSLRENILNCESLLEHFFEKRVVHLKTLGLRVLKSRYENGSYPEHLWRFDRNAEEDVSFRQKEENAVLAIAEISDLCGKKNKILDEVIKQIEERNNLRIKLTATVDEFSVFIKEKSKDIKSSALSTKLKADKAETLENEMLKTISSYENEALAIVSDVEKIYEQCMDAKVTKSIELNLLEQIRTLHEEFRVFLSVSRERFLKEVEDVKNKDEFLKQYSGKLDDSLNELYDIYIRNLCRHDLSRSDFKSVIQSVDKDIEKTRSLLQECSDIENEFLAKEINENPHKKFDYEDVNSWSKFVEEVLTSKKELLQRLQYFKALKLISKSEAKKLHLKYSKHSDSNQQMYIDKEGFTKCMKDLNVHLSEDEITHLFDTQGIKSKKDPNTKLFGFRKFWDFVHKSEIAKTRESISKSFSHLNNGLPFVTKNIVSKNVSFENLNFIVNSIKKASAKSSTEKLFFDDWLEENYSVPDLEELESVEENGSTAAANKKEVGDGKENPAFGTKRLTKIDHLININKGEEEEVDVVQTG